jgi:hypothetical protein
MTLRNVPVHHVTLREAITPAKRFTARRRWKLAVVALAGPAAEDRFQRYPPAEHPALWNSAWDGDARNAARYLGIDGDVVAAHREAARLVRRHWSVIERVADALGERGRLSGAVVGALIGGGSTATAAGSSAREKLA